jgi:hypothetical protein
MWVGEGDQMEADEEENWKEKSNIRHMASYVPVIRIYVRPDHREKAKVIRTSEYVFIFWQAVYGSYTWMMTTRVKNCTELHRIAQINFSVSGRQKNVNELYCSKIFAVTSYAKEDEREKGRTDTKKTTYHRLLLRQFSKRRRKDCGVNLASSQSADNSICIDSLFDCLSRKRTRQQRSTGK